MKTELLRLPVDLLLRTECASEQTRQTAELELAEYLKPAAALLRAGQLVAFPTETVYGLGADALNEDAAAAIFAAKGRPADNPLIVHIAGMDDLNQLDFDVPARAEALARRFWPGPLTLVLRRPTRIPDAVTAGLDSVAVRWPAHPVAQVLIRLAGTPVAAPSANRSGRPSPTLAEHVLADLNGRIPLIIDGGRCAVGLESTVLDARGDDLVILRPGAITAEAMAQVLGRPPVVEKMQNQERPRSPGVKYRHYAPTAPLDVLAGRPSEQVDQALAWIACHSSQAGRVALFLPADIWAEVARQMDPALVSAKLDAKRLPEAGQILYWTFAGSDLEQRAEQASHDLYAALRAADRAGARRIAAVALPEQGVGFAYMNRLRQAASPASGADQPAGGKNR